MRLLKTILLFGVIFLTSCFEHKPNIPGYHWRGEDLYNSNGEVVAAIVVFPFHIDSSQACVYSMYGMSGECVQFEAGQECYDYVERRFREYLERTKGKSTK